METLVGAIWLRRPYFYCERCRLGSAPLDAVLELAECRQQPGAQKAAVALTKEIPYETACELFEQWQYGAHPERPQAWCEAAVAQLFWGEVHGVI